jgi:hypothetical protein
MLSGYVAQVFLNNFEVVPVTPIIIIIIIIIIGFIIDTLADKPAR